jgi:predicted permease
VFVATQVACCLVSIVMAALLLRALHRATTVDLGFQMGGIDVASVDFGVGAYTDANAAGAIEELRQRLAAIPGVTSVGVGAVVPLAGDALGFGDLRRAGDPASESLISAEESAISPEYLPTMHIPIVRGRDFTSEDRQGAPGVAIVNERLAQALWPGEDPVGKPLEQGDFRPRRAASIRRLTVVGVARDAKYEWAGEAPRQFIYQPLAQQVWMRPLFFLASPPGVETATLSASVRRTLKDFDRNLPLIDMAPLRQYADLGLAPARIAASLAGSLGGLALALATLGLYGLTAFMVSSRTREIGVRIALGADRARIVRLVVAQGLALSTVGGVIGLFFAMAATRLLSSLLFGVSPLDPIAFGAAIAAVVVVAAVATYVPARRAAAVSPVVALRVD